VLQMQNRRGGSKKPMGTKLKPEQIHRKKIVAVARYDIFGKQLINTINKEVSNMGLLLDRNKYKRG